jgi:catechol 2,3-dioxygenase-like lactoylglutathione lyase family enzyme
MARSIRLYRLLGVELRETPDEGQVDTLLPNGIRFMLDTEGEVPKFDPQWRRETGNQLGLAFGCQDPAQVDEVYAHLIEAGFQGDTEPWDAFWGRRYAQVRDPDGVPAAPVATGGATPPVVWVARLWRRP